MSNLTIKQVSHLTGIPTHTLRFWEKEFDGILVPLRTQGGQRRYNSESISLIESIFKEMNKKISNSRILVLGFAFKGKPETDDMRYSPTLPILEYLKNKSVDVVGYDPMVPQEKIKNLGIKFEEPELIENVDCILIMNNNSKYLEIDFKKIKQNSKEPVGIMDGWQLLDVSYIKDLGFIYRGVGMVNN